MPDIIRIPRFVDGKIFYNHSISSALADVYKAEHEPIFMNELLGIRAINNTDSLIRHQGYCTPSVSVSGTTKQNTKVVVYAHVPNYFSDPKNIVKAIKEGLRNGAGKYPQKEFEKLLDMEDNQNVFVVDYDKLKNTSSEDIETRKALYYPQIIAFIGGREKAEIYLTQHEKVAGKKIGVCHNFKSEKIPSCSILYVHDISIYGILRSDQYLNIDGSFVGVPRNIMCTRRISSPLETLAGKGTEVGNGLVVIKREDITPSQYQILTRKE